MKAHYVCWDAGQTFEVLNPDAEAIDDAVFMAVHTDRPLVLLPPPRSTGHGQGPGSGSQIAASDFLAMFLDPARKHVQAAVVGSAGTGKSHLIHWMRLHIPAADDRLVITIPRSGTSLRGIVQLLIEQLPEDAREKYSAKLAEAGSDNLPPAVRLQSLIANVRLAILATEPAPDDEVEEWLLDDHLALLFQDPFLVRQLSADGGIFAELAEHIGQLHTYTRVESVRAFDFPDFQLVGADIDRLAEPTRAVIPQMIGNAKVRETAARLVNQAIPRAISAVLNFTGDQLVELLGDVRRFVASRGQEIVLLIEDFARLQGIDQALLQALLVQHSAQQPDLARLRWALAVTRGYWDARVRDTVLERMDFVLDMDAPTDYAVRTRDDEVKAFAARYLNAVRLPRAELEAWMASGTAGDPPNSCLGTPGLRPPCPYRTECHESFQEVGGVGLYPFNARALVQMLARKDNRYPAVINPRSIVGPVLKEVLGNRRQEFEDGAFPTESFLAGMGGRAGMQAVDVRWLSDRTAPLSDRYVATVCLWGDSARSAPSGVLMAFGLSPIDGGVAVNGGDEAPEEVTPTPVSSRSALEIALDAWGSGSPLPERFGRPLREYVFDAVTTGIEWDALGLERETFARMSGGEYFGARRISFQRQEVSAEGGPITLVIPASDDRDAILDASLALQALVSLRSTGRLPESNPWMYQQQLARHVALWTSHIANGLRRIAGPQDPERARPYARLLLLGAALSGVGRDATDPAGWIRAVFGDWNTRLSPASATWRQAVSGIPEWRDKAIGTYLAVSSAPKGGVARAAIDPRPLLLEFTQLQASGWRSSGVAGSAQPAGGQMSPRLAETLRQLCSQVDQILDEEWSRQRDWWERTRHELPEGQSASEVRPRVVRLRAELASPPLGFSRDTMEVLLRALDAMSADEVDRAREAIGGLAAKAPPPGLPELVEPPRLEAMAAWDRVAGSLRQLIRATIASAAAIDKVSDFAAQEARDRETIKQRLTAIIAAVDEVSG